MTRHNGGVDIIAARLLAQGLTEPLPSADDVVSRLVAIQAQDTWIAPYALRARLKPGEIPEAKGAVVNWLMRGTLHLVAAGDAAWLTSLLGPVFVAKTRPRRVQLGLTDDVLRREVAKVRQALPGTRAELLSHVDVPEGQARAHLLAYAGLTGVMVRRGDTFMPMPKGTAPRDPEGELARRYLAGHAPAGPQDFAAWSGLPLSTARRVLPEAAEPKSPLPIPPASPPSRGQLPIPPADPPSRGPLPIPPASPPSRGPEPPRVKLLGHLDPYLLGYKDRSFALDPAHAKKVNRGGGFLRPIVLVDGRVAGVWSRVWRKERLVITIDAWDTIPQDALNAEVEALGATIDR
jgi:Winged helix DNA-binding domain